MIHHTLATDNISIAVWLTANGHDFLTAEEQPRSSIGRRYYTWTFERTEEVDRLVKDWQRARRSLFLETNRQIGEGVGR